jgi:hypothetical protein
MQWLRQAVASTRVEEGTFGRLDREGVVVHLTVVAVAVMGVVEETAGTRQEATLTDQ